MDSPTLPIFAPPDQDNVELAEHIGSSCASFYNNHLSRTDIDPAILIHELRAVGLLVRCTGEPAA